MSIERYAVTVWPYSPGSTPDEVDPIMQGIIVLGDEGYALLDSRLYALVGEDYIGAYDISPTPLNEVQMPDILQAIVGDEPTENAEAITQTWNGVHVYTN